VTPVGIRFPQWRIALSFKGGDPFAAAAEERIATYLWTAVFVIALIAVLAFLIARHVSRQIRLTRLKNNLIASVSHELKTPLSSMRVLVDTLLEGRYRDEQQVREYLDLISKENLRLSRLIDNFLAFSRMERNKRTFEFKPVVPGEIISEACASVRERFEANGHILNIEVEPDLPMIHADRDALATVLINLLDNAYKYSGEDKRVTIRAFSESGSVFFRVEDNGIGIPRRALRRIFERFYQVDQSLSRSAGGCGLGLSIVKFIVNAHGGHINVESRVGKGSTFTVKIPARED
jgi:signal transduction histidine kinase